MSQFLKKLLQAIFALIVLSRGWCVNEAVFRKTKGKYLPQHVFKTLTAHNEFECTMSCLTENLCVSVNFKVSGIDQGLCELNNGTLQEVDDGQNDAENTYLEIHARTCEDKTQFFSKETKRCMSYASCKDLLDEVKSLSNDVYKLQVEDWQEQYSVYCHMTEIPGCGPGGWTLVMKIDGNETEFNYSSPYWTNKETYAVEDGLGGLTEKQTKLASYWNTAFSKICLGMKVNDDTKWIAINHQASSLYNVIANECFTTLSAGRDKWKSLITGSALQDNCNKAGFNFKKEWDYDKFGDQYMQVRIGIVANNQDDCETCSTCIGFGTSVRGCRGDVRNTTCGNIRTCYWFGNRDTVAFGYILVQ